MSLLALSVDCFRVLGVAYLSFVSVSDDYLTGYEKYNQHVEFSEDTLGYKAWATVEENDVTTPITVRCLHFTTTPLTDKEKQQGLYCNTQVFIRKHKTLQIQCIQQNT